MDYTKYYSKPVRRKRNENKNGRENKMVKKVSFWATKYVRRPTTVRFRRSDGSIARFRATKIIPKIKKVTFYARRRRY